MAQPCRATWPKNAPTWSSRPRVSILEGTQVLHAILAQPFFPESLRVLLKDVADGPLRANTKVFMLTGKTGGSPTHFFLAGLHAAGQP